MTKYICEIRASSWFYYKEICYDAWSHERKILYNAYTYNRLPEDEPSVSKQTERTDEPSETCRVSCQNKFVKLVHFWFYYKEICYDARSHERKKYLDLVCMSV